MWNPNHVDWIALGKRTIEGFSVEQKALAMVVGGMVVAVWAVESPLPGKVVRGLWSLRPRFRRPRGTGIHLGREWIPDEARVRGSQIVGGTGTGKSVALQRLIFADIERGNGAFIIDPKGDREMFERIKWFCKKIGRADDLHFLSATFPEESVVWNPCGLGDQDQLMSKFYNSGIYNEPHYAKACEHGLTLAFKSLVRNRPEGFGLLDLTEELEILARQDKDNLLAGLHFDLANVVQSKWGEVLGCNLARAKERQVSMLDICQGNEILVVWRGRFPRVPVSPVWRGPGPPRAFGLLS
jgi:hypothetical protein